MGRESPRRARHSKVGAIDPNRPGGSVNRPYLIIPASET